MGKDSRKRSRADKSKDRLSDATQLVGDLDALVALRTVGRDAVDRQAGDVARAMRVAWQDGRVVLRLDPDFADALVDTRRDTELVPDWLDRSPFRTFGVSLREPLELDDGTGRVCRYHGFFASGIRTRAVPRELAQGPDFLAGRGVTSDPAWTTYHPMSDSDGIRFLWLFDEPGLARPGGQTITAYLRGRDVPKAETLEALLAGVMHMYQVQDEGGGELPTLIPLSLILTLYLAAQDPDLEAPAPERSIRPQPLATADVQNIGWRVGAALRRYRNEAATNVGLGATGRRLPPHIRSAHFTRVRVATRDADGHIVGDVHGDQGTDWHYEPRWIPPTPVNMTDEGPDPVVRLVRQGDA